MVAGLATNLLFLFIRFVSTLFLRGLNADLHYSAIYRVIELSDGWTGTIIQTEVYFSEQPFLSSVVLDLILYEDVFDGAMIVLAIFIFNFIHPGTMIGPDMGKNRPEVDNTNPSFIPMEQVSLIGHQMNWNIPGAANSDTSFIPIGQRVSRA